MESWLYRQAEAPQAAQSTLALLFSGHITGSRAQGVALPIAALPSCLLARAGLPGQLLGLSSAPHRNWHWLFPPCFPCCLPFPSSHLNSS